MNRYHISKHQHFYAIGLSYKKADAETRGRFSLNEEQKLALLKDAKAEEIDALLVTSTCNRTEMYGFAQHPFQLIKLLCEHSKGSLEDFEKVAYVHKNRDAIAHMFRVGTGLDSQILGDFEIISQIKQSFVQSREHELGNAFLERLCNSVIQASKRIKNETELIFRCNFCCFCISTIHFSSCPEHFRKKYFTFWDWKNWQKYLRKPSKAYQK